MKQLRFTINVLGTNYRVFTDTPEYDDRLKEMDAYILPERKIIVLDKGNRKEHQRKVLAHEIVHAFLYESGLDVESWGDNEEIVDWIAIQVCKLNSVVKDAHKKLKPIYTKGKETKGK